MENKSLRHYPATVIFTAVSDKFTIPETEQREKSSMQGTKGRSMEMRAGKDEVLSATLTLPHPHRVCAQSPVMGWPSCLITVSSLTVSLTSTCVHAG